MLLAILLGIVLGAWTRVTHVRRAPHMCLVFAIAALVGFAYGLDALSLMAGFDPACAVFAPSIAVGLGDFVCSERDRATSKPPIRYARSFRMDWSYTREPIRIDGDDFEVSGAVVHTLAKRRTG